MSNTIQPQDLRIGNIIQHNGVYWYVTDIMSPEPLPDERFSDKWVIGLINNGMINVAIEEIEPIPLTEEILVKCGLYKVNHIHGYSFWTMDRRTGVNKWKPAISIYERYAEHCGHIIKPITCLHELQNTFYYTSGRELEIKL